MAVYVGVEEPPEEILSLPADTAWPDESLVWVGDVPIELNTADEMGRYSVTFNALQIRDELGERVRIETGVYLRVVVELPRGELGSSPACEAASFESPGGFPFRDNAGEGAEPFRGTERRSLIYAAGVGWVRISRDLITRFAVS